MRFRPLKTDSSTSFSGTPSTSTVASSGANTPDSYLPITMTPDSYLPMKGYRKIKDDSTSQQSETVVEPGVNSLTRKP